MTRMLTLPIEEAVAFGKVIKFLNSKGRNSESTKKGYTIALAHFEIFLKKGTQYNLETILDPLEKKEIDVYNLFDDFIDYLRNRIDVYNGNTKLSEKTIAFYIAGVKSYLEKYDVEISSKKLRNKVTMPKILRRKKETLNQKKIRNMLLACTNDRLKVFILVIASGGTRSMETLAIRNRDVDFEESPTKLHIIAENTKTKQDRDVYISDEAFGELKKFVETKYNDKFKNIKSNYPNDLVFSCWKTDKIEPRGIYGVLHKQFANLLRKIEMAQRKDGQGIQRRKISFHLFRDYVKTTVSKHTTKDFSEWMLGHSGSTYWNDEDDETKELYLKCMRFLTFLDYDVPETMGADYESKLEEMRQEKEQQIQIQSKEIKELRQRSSMLEDSFTKLHELMKNETTGWTKNMTGWSKTFEEISRLSQSQDPKDMEEYKTIVEDNSFSLEGLAKQFDSMSKVFKYMWLEKLNPVAPEVIKNKNMTVEELFAPIREQEKQDKEYLNLLRKINKLDIVKKIEQNGKSVWVIDNKKLERFDDKEHKLKRNAESVMERRNEVEAERLKRRNQKLKK